MMSWQGLLRLFWCFGLLGLTSLVLASPKRTEENLSEIQAEIEKSQQALQQKQQDITKLSQQLKKQEQRIAQSARSLNASQQAVKRSQKDIKQLQSKQADQIKIKKSHQLALKQQLKSAYMTGSHDYTQLLLNQEKSSTFERVLAYYGYFNNARQQKLDELKIILSELEKTQSQLQQKQQFLVEQRDQAKRNQEKLQAAQNERRDALSRLESQLTSNQSSLAYLRQNEATLLDTLADLREQAKQQPTEVNLTGLTSQKGQINWPSKGRLKHKFGHRKHGKLRWKGVLINAKTGTNVQSIQDGRVVFADWLKGFGWVIAVDHGKGFMSLYGHNQAILKEVGDSIKQGETIALVGQSGGQSDPGLYFEIRHKGRAVNPINWCRKI